MLLDTTQMYYYYFHKTPNMALKRVIMILAASLEFDRKHNSEIVERPSDDEEVPHVSARCNNVFPSGLINRLGQFAAIQEAAQLEGEE